MRYTRKVSIELPGDDSGMIGRECPRCTGQFKVDMESFGDSGYQNLRCPYCRFIAEEDRFMTGGQRAYIEQIQENEMRRLTEDVMGDIMGDVFSGEMFDLKSSGDPDFGSVPVASPEFTLETDLVECGECSFRYAVDTGSSPSHCPVCR